ncbi:hypothetical protein EON63_13875 [archaeon]|nr:MAG: hypothetical protein EON63_13875 [archaeon]
MGANLTEYQACLPEGRGSLPPISTPTLSYDLLEATVIQGLRRAGMISCKTSDGDDALPSDSS